MYDSLKELRDSHHLSGVKISFEDEGLNMDQAQIISSIAYKAGVDVSMKIGGAEAKRDIRDAKILWVNSIVAPMIESAYALKKFTDAISKVFTEDEMDDTNFLVNVETITGFKNVESMLSSPQAQKISWLVLWRSDFVGSMWKDKSYVNSDEMFQIASELAALCKEVKKKFYIGGNVNAESIGFFNDLKKIHLSGLETRNIIFDADVLSYNDVKSIIENAKAAIDKALNFELLWLQAKDKNYETILDGDKSRMDNIRSRFIK